MRIYIAGPMTGREDYNVAEFERVAQEWRDADPAHRVITPFASSSRVFLEKYGVPFDPEEHRIEYKDFMLREFFAEDIRSLLSCHMVIALNGWEQSRGARIELQVAQLFGLQAYDENEAIIDPAHVHAAVMGAYELAAGAPS